MSDQGPERPLRSKKLILKISRFFDYFFDFDISLMSQQHERTHHWFSALCLTGIDYFSSLAYQPGIALMAVGALAPFASLLLVAITLFGALPTYIEVTKRSFTGQGSIAMLETLLSGWTGKFCVLGLIAFAVTDFFITITLSASDAAAHIVENPYFSMILGPMGHSALGISIFLVFLLGVVFYLGLKEAIAIAVSLTIPFLILTAIITIYCFYVIFQDPSLIHNWLQDPVFKSDHATIFLVTLIAFPKLALGLSGFETGVSVMPIIHDDRNPEKADHATTGFHRIPVQRIRGARKLLITAASIMSVYLMGSSIVTSVLLKQADAADGGKASGRALSYLAHQYLGNAFGTVYDGFTVVILWFAGASAMAALLAIIPRYLPRFGMAPRWVELRKPLVTLVTLIGIVIILIFKANVNDQSGAYATGVLAVILSASIAVALSLWKEYKQEKRHSLRIRALYFVLVSLAFVYTLLDNIHERPDGLIIASIFFVVILLASSLSRWRRAFELRVESHKFIDEESEKLFEQIKNKKIDLVPISFGGESWFKRKQEKIQKYYKENNDMAFLIIKLRDDRSAFATPLEIRVSVLDDLPHQDINQKTYLIEVFGAVAIPNTIAYISEQIDPIAIYLGLARQNAMYQALSYVLFGEGEIGMVTYKVLVKYWESTKEDDVRPVIFLMSE